MSLADRRRELPHPAGVHAVAGEATGELVVHPAAVHGGEGLHGHPARGGVAGALVVAEQELQDHRRRELRRAAEPAAGGVERLRQRGDGAGQLLRVRDVRCRGQRLPLCQHRGQLRTGLPQLLASIGPGVSVVTRGIGAAPATTDKYSP